MLRSYNAASNKQFQFGYTTPNSSKSAISTKINNQDARILNQIETEINNLVSRVKSLGIGNGFIDTTNYNLVINRRISLIVKSILNQYDIGHFERNKWCGIRKYTVIKFDKIIPRIISKPPRDVSTPLEQIISNAINIKIPHKNTNTNTNTNANSTSNTPSNDTYKHDYLNPANKAQARKLRGIYNA